jgi:hypothetical protein
MQEKLKLASSEDYSGLSDGCKAALADARKFWSRSCLGSIRYLGEEKCLETIPFLTRIATKSLSVADDVPSARLDWAIKRADFALEALGLMDHPTSHAVLVKICRNVHDFHPYIVRCAVRASGFEAAQFDLSLVLDFLAAENDFWLQIAALNALSLQIDEENYEALAAKVTPLLESSRPEVRMEVLCVLGVTSKKKNIELVYRYFEDNEYSEIYKTTVSDEARGIVGDPATRC